MKTKLNFIVFTLLLFAAACTTDKKADEPKDAKQLIVCTTSMIGDLTDKLIDEKFEVISLMGAGVDPHLYTPTNKDIQALKSADIIILNGLHLEEKMQTAVEKLEDSKTIITIADGIPESKLIATSEFTGNYDPHLWFDVTNWADCSNHVAAELIKVSPESKMAINTNAEAALKEYMTLHKMITQKINQIPDESKVLVTAHDAFSYFARTYGIEVKALQGISTSGSFGIKDVLNLTDFLVSRQIKSVFVESSVSNKSLTKVMESCADKGHEVKIGGELFTDAMGEAGTKEGTYIGMMEHNLETIVNNLK